MSVSANPRVVIGDNMPPPFVAHSANIDDLYEEAANFLDDQPIENEGQAQAIAKILDDARRAFKAADEQRKTEKRPHDEAAQAVQDAWNPLLARAKRIETVAKAAQTDWLLKLDVLQRAEAEKARLEAERLQSEALAAKAAVSDLTASAAVEELLADAGKATRLAAKLDKAKPQVAGGSRAQGLRTKYVAELSDSVAALRHYREHQPEALKQWLTEQAQRDVNAGARLIPGFNVNEERKAA